MRTVHVILTLSLPCLAMTACYEADLSSCTDGNDNNLNGFVDCDDPGCESFCGSDDDESGCDPGETYSCTCPDGSTSSMTCDADGEWSACDCGGGDDDSGDDDVGDDDNDSGDDDTQGANAPEVTSLTTNSPSITEGDSVTFFAVVTDPQGYKDIGGGMLQTPNGTQYAFFDSAGPGSYQVTLSWSEIHNVETIHFENPAGEARTFVASFFDQGGDTGEESVQVQLQCQGDGACTGICTPLDTNNDCGSCGNVCQIGVCLEGGCVGLFCEENMGVLTSCGNYCTYYGLACPTWLEPHIGAYTTDINASCGSFNPSYPSEFVLDCSAPFNPNWHSVHCYCEM
jgi:hypothetical protein